MKWEMKHRLGFGGHSELVEDQERKSMEKFLYLA